jgi:hypothetical protein
VFLRCLPLFFIDALKAVFHRCTQVCTHALAMYSASVHQGGALANPGGSVVTPISKRRKSKDTAHAELHTPPTDIDAKNSHLYHLPYRNNAKGVFDIAI